MKKGIVFLIGAGLLYSAVAFGSPMVNADTTGGEGAPVTGISPYAFNIYTEGTMSAEGSGLNGLTLQGNDTVTTGEITFHYDGNFVGIAGFNDETDFVFNVPDELAPLVNSENFKQYISADYHFGTIGATDYTYTQNDITIEDDGHTIRFANPDETYIVYAPIEINITLNLGQAVTETGIRIADAENNSTYDFVGVVIGRGEFIDWTLIGDTNAPYSLPTYRLDPGWEIVNRKPTIETVTDKDTVVSGAGTPGAQIQVKVGDQIIGEGVVGETGIYHVTIDSAQAEGVTISVSQNAGPGWSEAATTIVVHEGEEIPAPTVNPVTDQDTLVKGKGNTPGNIITIVNQDGDFVGQGTVLPDNSFSISIPAQEEYTTLFVTESNGTETSPATSVVVKAGEVVSDGAITSLDSYSISRDTWINGTFEGEGTILNIIVNGQTVATAGISEEFQEQGIIRLYGKGYIHSVNDVVQIQLIGPGGIIDTKTLNVVA